MLKNKTQALKYPSASDVDIYMYPFLHSESLNSKGEITLPWVYYCIAGLFLAGKFSSFRGKSDLVRFISILTSTM